MKLSISNIGWSAENDTSIYSIMKKYGFSGLEIAPTRIFPNCPYDKLEEAHAWAKELKSRYGFWVSSMQSIWFGRQERLFGSEEEREILIDYTKKAVDFAVAIQCGNLVFGCPRNRVLPDKAEWQSGIDFFKLLGDYAAQKGTVIGMEANPPIYNTNFINDTAVALKLIEEVDSPGFLLNLDLGTMIQNSEPVELLQGKVRYVNHVHISEPGLKPIQERTLHKKLRDILRAENYQGFISIEMGKIDELNILENIMKYIREIWKL